ncbi:transcription termination/antitermination protein NusG [Aquisphaera insulae]|uniref:transcription termination/antitermination protein NusG n=1 Tax=Aquisphaera insulae TaxID=2712864 RepID=UPI0013EDDAAB|nr:transcription termination/antitermination NusG family protein [Aquisphaera insulae]
MTILGVETDFYPDELWDPPSNVLQPSTGRQWWCLHTKPRQEKAVARDLRNAKISFYLPQMISERLTPKGRRIRSVLPVFTSYVFLKGDENDRLEALRCNRLVNVLEVFDQESLDLDLRRIHRLIMSRLPLVAEPLVLPGTTVRIMSGPLTGLKGTVIRRENSHRFVAMVRFLSRGASVQLQNWQVEADKGGEA